jgi:superoxide dismutase, Fe-Mn family
MSLDQQTQTATSQYCQLPKLPFEKSALEPVISRETIEYHYGKHHKGYVDKLNSLIHGSPLANFPLEEVVKKSTGKLFNNAAQVWNHNFYWNCLAPKSKEPTSGKFFDCIEHCFGSMTEFKLRFSKCGEDLFGSGYVWLVKDRSDLLSIIDTANADNPLTMDMTPVLTCDVWEHAYYVDYRNVRKDYLKKFWSIVNWDFIESRFSSH